MQSLILTLAMMTFGTGCTSMKSVNASETEISVLGRSEPSSILKVAQNYDIKDFSRWKLDGTTVIFNGGLAKGDCQQFIGHINPKTTSLKVNSSGGDAFEGLCIANEMLKRRFEKTIVKGICVSSCANYLFLGSNQRIIERGIVGYHGNITALFERDPTNQALRKQLAEAHIDLQEIERIASKFIGEQQAQSVLEQRFLHEIGVSQELFERTQTPDKGAGDGKNYTFLLPSLGTFTRYGVARVSGDQEFALGQSMGMTNLLQ